MTETTKEPMRVVDKRRNKEHLDSETVIVDIPAAPDNTVAKVIAPQSQPGPQSASLIESVERVYADPVPIFDRVLIRQHAKETFWAGTKFVIPESARQAPNQGVVVAASAVYFIDGKPQPMAELVKPGDLVDFSKFNAEEITVDGEPFVICTVFDLKLIHPVTFAYGAPNASC